MSSYTVLRRDKDGHEEAVGDVMSKNRSDAAAQAIAKYGMPIRIVSLDWPDARRKIKDAVRRKRRDAAAVRSAARARKSASKMSKKKKKTAPEAASAAAAAPAK